MAINPNSIPAPYRDQAIAGLDTSSSSAQEAVRPITQRSYDELAEMMDPQDYAAYMINLTNQRQDTAMQHAREDSAYQRAAADLKKAGLNPWLLLSGMGASASSASPSYTASSNASANAKRQSETSKDNATMSAIMGLVGSALMALAVFA